MLFYAFLSEGKYLLMINIQLCLAFERVSVRLKKSRAYGYGVYGYGYYSYKTLSCVQ